MKKFFSAIGAYFKRRWEWWDIWFSTKRFARRWKKEFHESIEKGVDYPKFADRFDTEIRARIWLQDHNH